MAERLLQTHDMSDLCIGKPALRWLPPSSTVADAVAELEGGGGALAVWDGSKEEGTQTQVVAGRVCMADVLLFLCADANLASPAAALQATLADLLAAGAPPVRLIQRNASVLEAADAFLDGAHSLVVPIRDRRRELCWLTLEDLVRFFLSSVALFSPTASRSVSDLGLIRPANLALAAGDAALSAVPLLRTALATHAAVAVVSGESFPRSRQLVGDISPSGLGSSCSVAVAAAVAALSAGDLLAFIDWGGAPPDATLHAVRSRLCRRGLHGMLDLLLYGRDPSSSSCSSSSSSASSSSSSSSSSDEEEDDYGSKKSSVAKRGNLQRTRSIGMGRRRAEEAIVCHRRSSLVAVMVQAMAHRATQVWVVDDDDQRDLVGVVGLLDVLRVLRHHLHQFSLAS
ncbi:hypothetical protein PR202_ga18560 [Eleusine coracana subsp. coracana]|uniref:CBS domain-containing protein n=1 Tax=Eleusine coracana subsp. coracana TaxID=191504 RepID=A0AAV5CS29_ELECO|nr:hypothetical protein QOZ80_4AG0299220 [Eleusine coracana subsp. coracana]GJN01303.1 hypothetical protein PR202_ga18560 [Eleusine coracana subsp. coracana]